MSISTNNLWERDRLRKLTTIEQVDAEIAWCEAGQRVAPNHKSKEWRRKLVWLDKLRRELKPSTINSQPSTKR